MILVRWRGRGCFQLERNVQCFLSAGPVPADKALWLGDFGRTVSLIRELPGFYWMSADIGPRLKIAIGTSPVGPNTYRSPTSAGSIHDVGAFRIRPRRRDFVVEDVCGCPMSRVSTASTPHGRTWRRAPAPSIRAILARRSARTAGWRSIIRTASLGSSC